MSGARNVEGFPKEMVAFVRIYRDTRFSLDKTPHKTHIACSFGRRGGEHMSVSGFYFGVSSDEIEVARGIYHPAADTTLLVRTYITGNYNELRHILAAKKLRQPSRRAARR